jgi:rubrerythrin
MGDETPFDKRTMAGKGIHYMDNPPRTQFSPASAAIGRNLHFLDGPFKMKRQRRKRRASMGIQDDLEAAIDLEMTISDCYKKLSRNAVRAEIASSLEKIGREEINHANILRMQKNLSPVMEDLFGEKAAAAGQIRTCLRQARDLSTALDGSRDFEASLIDLRNLEIAIEKIHRHTAVDIRDESLRNLFDQLAGMDRAHADTLGQIIESL